jgi:hypothetical protein
LTRRGHRDELKFVSHVSMTSKYLWRVGEITKLEVRKVSGSSCNDLIDEDVRIEGLDDKIKQRAEPKAVSQSGYPYSPGLLTCMG